MFGQATGVWKFILPILFFPMFFQSTFVGYAWGAEDPLWLMAIKRIFLLLPVLAFIVGCWASIACLLTVVIRQKRREFVTGLVITWWDLGKSIVSFWGGLGRFVFVLLSGVLAFVKTVLLGIWIFLHDLVLIPFRVVRIVGQNILSPGMPWIAVTLTLAWCLFEAAVFAYVSSPLVVDSMSNLTGDNLSEDFVQIPLFVFMFFIILSSYAVLNIWTEAIRQKKLSLLLKITVVELLAMTLEVLFLYREFVDLALLWFTQNTANEAEFGVTGVLVIASLVWIGIRAMTWIGFGSHGVPTLIAIIQGTGVRSKKGMGEPQNSDVFAFTMGFVTQMKQESLWFKDKGDEVVGAFILPPLQIVAAALNFCTLLLTTQHLFRLPFKHVNEVMDAQQMLKNIQLRGK